MKSSFFLLRNVIIILIIFIIYWIFYFIRCVKLFALFPNTIILCNGFLYFTSKLDPFTQTRCINIKVRRKFGCLEIKQNIADLTKMHLVNLPDLKLSTERILWIERV